MEKKLWVAFNTDNMPPSSVVHGPLVLIVALDGLVNALQVADDVSRKLRALKDQIGERHIGGDVLLDLPECEYILWRKNAHAIMSEGEWLTVDGGAVLPQYRYQDQNWPIIKGLCFLDELPVGVTRTDDDDESVVLGVHIEVDDSLAAVIVAETYYSDKEWTAWFGIDELLTTLMGRQYDAAGEVNDD